MTHIEEAQYTPSSLPVFRGNPLIDALPDYLAFSFQQLRKLLHKDPDPIQPQANRRQKSAWLMTLNKSLFVELPFHLHLLETVDITLRQGYHQRKPMTPEHRQYLHSLYQRQQAGDKDVQPDYGTTAADPLSISVLGCSGIGKTTAIARILSLYPQVIHHRPEMIGAETLQVTFLRVECPHDGSVKTLCCNIIKALDDATGQNYTSVYVTRRVTLDMLKDRMSRLLAVHYVGMLVIDEIQNLMASRKNREELFNFIVSLANTIGVPILYVGTPKIAAFMERDLRIARRFGSMGSFRWDRIEKDSNDWKALMDRLWACNVLEGDEAQVPKEISDAFYDCSQGIIDVLVKLFILSQMQHLVYRSSKMTKEGIYDEFEANFERVMPMIDALRNGDVEKIALYDDINMPEREFQEKAEKKYRAVLESTTEIDELEEEIQYPYELKLLARMGFEITPDIRQKFCDPANDPAKEMLQMIQQRTLQELKDQNQQQTKQQLALTTDDEAEIGSLD